MKGVLVHLRKKSDSITILLPIFALGNHLARKAKATSKYQGVNKICYSIRQA